jgi:hypothetical protein
VVRDDAGVGGAARGVVVGGYGTGGGGGGVDVAKRRLRRGSGEMSPAKRVRGGEDD